MAEDENDNGSGDDAATFMTCCNDEQTAFIYLYIIFLASILVTSDTIVAKPGRLLATAVHEICHAIVCWLTCGEVRQLEVYSNEGGVTRYVGGSRCLIAPAGYLGEAFVGMLACICSGGRITATAAAVSLIVALLGTLCYAPNRTLVGLVVFYAFVTGGLILVEWFYFSPVLAYVTLFSGVFLGVCALVDIFRHLILSSRPGSDAYSLYEESGRCCPPRLIGFVWLIIATLMQLTGIYIALILTSDECSDLGWFQCIFKSRLELDMFKHFEWWPDDWDWPDFDFDFDHH